MTKQKHILALTGAALAAACLAVGLVRASDQGNWPASKVSAPTPQVAGMPAALAKNLANFDDLDFHVYTGQKWVNLHKSHAQDIVVYYPDGHTTKGIPDHIKELNFMWTFAPDNRNAKYVSERRLPEAEATFRDIQDDDLAVHFSESLTKSS